MIIYPTVLVKNTAQETIVADFDTYDTDTKRITSQLLEKQNVMLEQRITGQPHTPFILSMEENDFDALVALLGADIKVLGAWQKNGLQVGLERANPDLPDVVSGNARHAMDEALLRQINHDRRDPVTGNPLPRHTNTQDALTEMPVIFGQEVRQA